MNNDPHIHCRVGHKPIKKGPTYYPCQVPVKYSTGTTFEQVRSSDQGLLSWLDKHLNDGSIRFGFAFLHENASGQKQPRLEEMNWHIPMASVRNCGELWLLVDHHKRRRAKSQPPPISSFQATPSSSSSSSSSRSELPNYPLFLPCLIVHVPVISTLALFRMSDKWATASPTTIIRMLLRTS